ncbi:putative RNA-binding protein 18 [Nymphaea thermarum]|nr:putative RNA-binding protein 18 [Nymphaea thermarum]
MPLSQPNLPSSSSSSSSVNFIDSGFRLYADDGYMIVSEDFLWHRHGPRRGEPRGFAFIQFGTREVSCSFSLSLVSWQFLISVIEVSMQEAQLAMEKMDGRLACGRPLVVRFAGEKATADASKSSKGADDLKKSGAFGCFTSHMSRSSKIAAIKNKLKSMEEENCSSVKKPRQAGTIGAKR